MTHWARDLVGRPWAPDADGPEAFSCWGLVRWVVRHHHGIELPRLQLNSLGDAENVAALRQAAAAGGWHPTDHPVQADDIVLMRELKTSARHVGVMILSLHGLRLLHSVGHMTADRAVGLGVVAERLKEALTAGYTNLEVWRRTA